MVVGGQDGRVAWWPVASGRVARWPSGLLAAKVAWRSRGPVSEWGLVARMAGWPGGQWPVAMVAKWSISSRGILMAQRVSGGRVASWPIVAQVAMVASGHGLASEQYIRRALSQ